MNAHYVIIDFRAKFFIKIQNQASDTSRSLPSFSSAPFLLRVVPSERVGKSKLYPELPQRQSLCIKYRVRKNPPFSTIFRGITTGPQTIFIKSLKYFIPNFLSSVEVSMSFTRRLPYRTAAWKTRRRGKNLCGGESLISIMFDRMKSMDYDDLAIKI